MIGTSPCAAMRGMRRGKQKGAGALPEMASGTLPLLRRFGSKHDELITREQHVRKASAEGTNKILLLRFLAFSNSNIHLYSLSLSL